MQEWINEKNKSQVDTFHLYFNDSLSYFGPPENNLPEMGMSWMTPKNKVYQNLKTKSVYSIKDAWGEESHMTDTAKSRMWQIVPGRRTICGYDCQKARWKANDSLNIYAYFSSELTTSIGPESFTGLPGAILGLATEDGGVVYFAKQVLLERVDIEKLRPKKNKKVYKSSELEAKLRKDMKGNGSWGKILLDEMFGVW